MGKICFFNTAKAWGGGEKWHFEVSKQLNAKGYDVMVIAGEDSALLKKIKETNIPYRGIQLSNLSFLNPLKHLSLTSTFRKERFNTIVMNLSRDVKIAGPCAKRANVKRIIYRRGSAIPIKNSFLNRYYFKNIVTEILANSQATKKTVLENNTKLFPQKDIRVIYNGVEIQESTEQFNHHRKTNSKELFLVNLGRLEYQKNQKFLIRLSKQLKDKNISHKMIIGGTGRLKGELESLIQKYGVSEHVHLKGFIEEPIHFISQADVFVLSSLWEGFGYVLAEAAMCKKPIVAFNVSSNPELVLDGKTGFLVPLNNLKDFTNKIIRLQKNPTMRKEMGIAGRNHIVQNFDKTQQEKKIESYLINGE
ncbi:glycosyltransferase [Muricauda sp. NFXS6]|uniref:glycosyltransferase n=1 Tax=Allomuricauda sp. NFXS6 TaxID=2819094 RepID=UPI0032DEB2AA